MLSSTKQHPDDLSLNADLWLRHVDVPDRFESATEIDRLLVPTAQFWSALAIHCVPECCGINAYGFWPDDIIGAIRLCDDQTIRDKLLELRQQIASMNASCIKSEMMNEYMDRDFFLQILDHILGASK